MSQELRLAAAVQLVGLVVLGVYSWDVVAGLEPLRWPVAALVWLGPFLWLLRSPALAAAAMQLPLAPLLGWAVWYLVATNWSPDQRPAVAFSLGVLSTILSGHWFVATFGWARFARLAAGAIAAFLVIGVLYRVFVDGPLLGDGGRFAGIGNNPTDTGRHAAAMALLGWGGFVGRRRWQVVFLVGGFGFAALAIAKTALVGLAVGVAIIGFQASGRHLRSTLLLLAAATLVLGAVAFTSTAGSTEVAQGEGEVAPALTLTGRTDVWGQTFEAIEQRPIVGYGTGSSTELFGGLITSGDLSWRVTNAHNLWLQSWLEHGPLGLGLLLVTFVGLAIRCVAEPEPARDALLVLLAVNSMTETLVQFPSLALLIVAGAIGSLPSRRSIDEADPAPEPAAVAP